MATLTLEQYRAKLKRIEQLLDPKNLARAAYPVFVDETPRKTGNARSKTRLRGNTITADYPYAKRLDQGWSKQSPRGMVKPTLEFLDEYINNEIRKI